MRHCFYNYDFTALLEKLPLSEDPLIDTEELGLSQASSSLIFEIRQ